MRKADAGRSEGFEVLYVRIPAHLKERLQHAAAAKPFRVPITAIIERGVELALKELNDMRKGEIDVATVSDRRGRR